MFENVKEFYEETVTKENIISLTREPTASLLSGNVEYPDEINNYLMIKVDLIEKRNPLEN